jgi:iron complex transport system substrate-binding protein
MGRVSTPTIATLLPSATELVCALGARERLVGRSHECDHPAGVETVPVLTRSRVRTDLASGLIDADVRRLLQEALAVYEVDVDGLERAAPEVIVTQDLCDVCAVSLHDVEAAVRELGIGARVVSLSPTTLTDVWDDLGRVGEAIGCGEEAASLRRSLQARVEAVSVRRPSHRPSVLTVEWLDPVMVGGTWMPELVELAGGRPLVTSPGDHAPTLDEQALSQLTPDVVLVKPCGYRLDRTRGESGDLRALLDRLAWPAWRAGQVWIADGNAYFNRPGPRLVESLEILAACVHPEEYGDLAALHGDGFERLEP